MPTGLTGCRPSAPSGTLWPQPSINLEYPRSEFEPAPGLCWRSPPPPSPRQCLPLRWHSHSSVAHFPLRSHSHTCILASTVAHFASFDFSGGHFCARTRRKQDTTRSKTVPARSWKVKEAIVSPVNDCHRLPSPGTDHRVYCHSPCHSSLRECLPDATAMNPTPNARRATSSPTRHSPFRPSTVQQPSTLSGAELTASISTPSISPDFHRCGPFN